MERTLVKEELADIQTNTGENLMTLSEEGPIMLVFLRHFGCVFCKEALSDLNNEKESIKAKGVKLIFIHMATHEVADEYFTQFGFNNPLNVSDPDSRVYRRFGISKGSFSQLYGLRTWISGFKAKKESGFELELAKKLGDSTQMPGIFLIHRGIVKERYIHKYASDRPDYAAHVNCCVT